MGSEYFESYPHLDALVGGWFHQDFDVDGGTLEEVMASYRGRAPEDERLGAQADIMRFLRNTASADVEEEFNSRFSPGGYPGRDDLGVREWLLKVCALL